MPRAMLLTLILAAPAAHADGEAERALDATRKRLLSVFDNAMRQGAESSAYQRFSAGLAEARAAHGFVAVAELTDAALARLAEAEAAALEALDARWLDVEPLRDALGYELEKRRRRAVQTVVAGRYGLAAKSRKQLDARIGELRQAWSRPAEVIVEIDGPSKKLWEQLTRWRALRKAVDPAAPDPGAAKIAALRQVADAALDPRRNPGRGFDHARLIEGWRAAIGANAAATWASAEEREVIRLVNAHRVMLGRGALTINLALTGAARAHSEYMAKVRRLAHNIGGHPAGDGPEARARGKGYAGKVRENILVDSEQQDPAHLVWMWQGSPPHHRTMLDERAVDTGVGGSGWYWTQVFGLR